MSVSGAAGATVMVVCGRQAVLGLYAVERESRSLAGTTSSGVVE